MTKFANREVKRAFCGDLKFVNHEAVDDRGLHRCLRPNQ